MTYVRETCGCCGESWPPRGGGARLLVSLGGPRPGVMVICLGRALPSGSLCPPVRLAVHRGRVSQGLGSVHTATCLSH